ncbi:hypothetical protein M422DRAFT_34085 [Sphaerobolus stellatus SS14]|uniref:Uncharacterized protein n=1 Tax=Sphaerobolus stellatus (strain SS14) TaxID=990650 RepID=A0A0C9V4S5_SPHS4|nr:hypothetical protein M422DRAFT_38577 [Sphaerobolus stellatus SS14]KIJ36707.1 hypothetical protein M422DRAFT_34085 [Sphaerobolus stellatus SS14]
MLNTTCLRKGLYLADMIQETPDFGSLKTTNSLDQWFSAVFGPRMNVTLVPDNSSAAWRQ